MITFRTVENTSGLCEIFEMCLSGILGRLEVIFRVQENNLFEIKADV